MESIEVAYFMSEKLIECAVNTMLTGNKGSNNVILHNKSAYETNTSHALIHYVT